MERDIVARQTAAIHATLQKDMAAMAMALGVAKNCTPVSWPTTSNPRPGTVARARASQLKPKYLLFATAPTPAALSATATKPPKRHMTHPVPHSLTSWGCMADSSVARAMWRSKDPGDGCCKPPPVSNHPPKTPRHTDDLPRDLSRVLPSTSRRCPRTRALYSNS